MTKTKPPRAKKTKADIPKLLAKLAELYPDAACSLAFQSPFELLVATVLAAQCTDERVNRVTPGLFKTLPTIESFAKVPQARLEKLIHSTGFFHNKAKALRGMSQQILDKHAGEVPRTMEALTALPGVGRKTANVVLGNAYGITEGVVVDTHVTRLSGRLGLSRQKTPEKIEVDLQKVVPRADWTVFSHRLVMHGRGVCQARAPRCTECPLADLCPSAGKTGK